MIESIKKFFKKIFGIRYQKKLPEINKVTTCKKIDLRDEIKIEDNTEILELQKNYEAGKINENNISKNKIKKLISLYEKQIEEIEYKIKLKKV